MVAEMYEIKKAQTISGLGFAAGRNRTNDTRIFSPLLYQLSYSGKMCIYYTQTKKMSTAFQIFLKKN